MVRLPTSTPAPIAPTRTDQPQEPRAAPGVFPQATAGSACAREGSRELRMLGLSWFLMGSLYVQSWRESE